MKLTKKEKSRFEELSETAREKFLDCSDYNVEDWLDTEKEKKEYRILFKKFLENLGK